MKSFFIILLSLVYLQFALPQYSISYLPEELKSNSNAIIRKKHITLEIISKDNILIKKHIAITILKEKSQSLSNLIEYYDKYSDVDFIDGYVYDENGKVVEKIKSSDLMDYCDLKEYALYSDNRMKLITPKYRICPYTVEYKYEKEIKGFLGYDNYFITDYNLAFEEGSLTVQYPKDFKIRFYQLNLDSKPVIIEKGKTVIIRWNINNYKAIIQEPYSKTLLEISPAIFIVPEADFKYKGVDGNFETWEKYSSWLYNLNKGRDNLDDNTIAFIKNLVKDVDDEYEKVKILYLYMQKKTRYVNISIDLGNIQPVSAEVVNKVSYGDCKALSNYMYTLLKYAGINSIYAIINAGNTRVTYPSEFVMHCFNHAILCVPLKDDTIWLECTSKIDPAGYVSSFIDDRNVLLVLPQGGKIVRTPQMKIDDNIRRSKIQINILKDMRTNVNLNSIYKGLQFEKMYSNITSDKNQQKNFLKERLSVPDCNVKSIDYNMNLNNKVPELSESAEIVFLTI